MARRLAQVVTRLWIASLGPPAPVLLLSSLVIRHNYVPICICRERDRLTDTQTDDRQTDRQTGRQAGSERERKQADE
jgi:hypothetical protein